MKITNNANLPTPLVAAIANDQYDGARYDITASSLSTPPRIRQLMRRHSDELTEDAADRIWALIGQVGHAILEHAPGNNDFREERLIGVMDGWTIGGKVDLLRLDGDSYAIDDYKLVSLWAMKDEKPEWTLQLNTYAWLARGYGFDIKQLRIVGILRDWSKLRAQREKDYPQQGVVIREVPLWPEDVCQRNIREAVTRHQQAAAIADEADLPLCTPEERWERPTVYAVKKKGNKRAHALLETTHEAAEMINTMGGNYEVEKRVGESVRCLNYCNVREFCAFGKNLAAESFLP